MLLQMKRALAPLGPLLLASCLLLALLGQPASAYLRSYGIETVAERIIDLTENGLIGAALAVANDTNMITAPVQGRGKVYTMDSITDIWKQNVLLVPLDGGTETRPKQNPYIGSVAIYDNVAIVGSPDDPGPLNNLIQAGAVYVFHRDIFTFQWKQEQKIYSQIPVSGDQYGFAVAMNQFFVCISLPYRQLSNARQQTGAIDVYQRIYTYAKTDSFVHVYMTTLFSATAQTNDHIGASISMSKNMLGVGGPSRFTDTQSDVGIAVIWNYRKGPSGFGWFQEASLMKDNPLVGDEFGKSVSISSAGFFLVGSTTQFARKGMAQLYKRSPSTRWFPWQTFQAPTPQDGDSFGAQVAIFDSWLIISAPRYDATGVIYGWRLNGNTGFFEQAMSLRPTDPFTLGFGTAMTMSDSFVLIGAPVTPLPNGNSGAVYTYNGYAFFPIKPPTFWVPSNSDYARALYIVTELMPFFVEDTLDILVKSRFYREVSIATYDTSDPVANLSFATINPATGLVAYGGGILEVPAIAGIYPLRAISYYQPEEFVSSTATVTINVSIPILGFYWHGDDILVSCEFPWYYCPGIFSNPFRYRVQLAWYSAPESVPLDRRSYQQPCEQNRFCDAGLAYNCSRDYCWPMPLSVVAREALPGELGPNGESYYDMRLAGISVGDVIQFLFDEVGTRPVMNSTQLIQSLMDFNCPIGYDGFNYTGRWANASLLLITITTGSWNVEGVTDPALTRIGVLAFKLKASGNLRRQNVTTLPSRMAAFELLTGSWGDFAAPTIIRAEAFPGVRPDNGSAPATGDYLLLDFNVPLETRSIGNQIDLLKILEFSPPLTNVTYYARYKSWFQIEVIFNATIDAPLYPNLYNYSQSVPNLRVRIQPSGVLRSRDFSSPPSSTAFVTLQGTWGDIPEDLVVALFSPNEFGIYWTVPSTRVVPPPYYQCQVSLDSDFSGPYPTTIERFILANESIALDKLIVPFAYDLEFVWAVTGLAKSLVYWIQCRAYLDTYYGPWTPTLPPSMVIDQPVILGLDRFTTDLPTQGGPVNVVVRNMGYGRHVYSLEVNMTYTNGNYFYVAYNCHVAWNGSVVSCIAPEGVGRDHRWTMNLHGFAGYQSAPHVVLNYKPPVLYDIYSLYNNTLTSPSNGSEEFNVTGVNFGPISLNAVWWVRYSPRAYPALVYAAACDLIVSHFVLRCRTGQQAGANLYWRINVAGQVSQVPFTTTRIPNITAVTVLHVGLGYTLLANGTAVGAVPVRSAGRVIGPGTLDGVSTTGGGIVLIKGTDFGPDSVAMNMSVRVRPTRLMPPTANEYFVDRFGYSEGVYLDEGPRTEYAHVFPCLSCAVTVPHFEITCVVPQGYGGQLEWYVEVLDAVSLPFRTNISYAVPSIELLPLPHEEGDLFASTKYPFHPINNSTSARQHQNLSLLGTFTYVPTTNDTHYVTDCNTSASSVSRLGQQVLKYPRISLQDALAATSTSKLTAYGYPNTRAPSGMTSYRGGDLFMMVDGSNNRFNTGACTVWREQIVLVASDDHWIALTGHNFVYGFDDGATVRAVINGVQLPAASCRVRDNELVEVLLPAFLGRRRLQLDVNGVRSNAMVLVNAKPVVHGFMEWRLGMEDIRGPSPRTEDVLVNVKNTTAVWGGFGAWNLTNNCSNIVVVGHHFGSAADLASGRVKVTVDGLPCVLLTDMRHHRFTCCIANETISGDVVVSTGGQSSSPVLFTRTKLVRKPVVLDYKPKTTSSDGGSLLNVTAQYLVLSGGVLFSTPGAEAYVPTGYEATPRGNYDVMPRILVPPSPTPTPPLEGTDEDAYSTPRSPGCTWRTIWPHTTDSAITGTVYLFTNSTVLAQVPANHAAGHFFRISVPSPIDRTLLFTDAYFIPFFRPTIKSLEPAALPLSGGVLNIHGHSFGNGGRVYIKQRLYYTSTSVSGDPVYAGLYTVPHEVDGLKNVPGMFLGITGQTIGFNPRILASPAVFEAIAQEAAAGGSMSAVTAAAAAERRALLVDADLTGAYAAPGRAGPLAGRRQQVVTDNAPQYAQRYVTSECLLLSWNHTFIRCVVQPGMDNLTTVMIDTTWGVGSLPGGLLFQPSVPCEYNTTFRGTFKGRPVPSFRQQFITGLWTGLGVGLGCLLSLLVFGAWMGKIDVGSMVTALLRSIALAPRPPKGSTAGAPASGSATSGKGLAGRGGSSLALTRSGAGDGSFIDTDFTTGKRSKHAPLPLSATNKPRNIDEVIQLKQKHFMGGGTLSGQLEESTASPPGMWATRHKRASDASFQEMEESVERQANDQLAAREKADRAAYRRKHNLNDYDEPLQRAAWWQCCCCAFRPRLGPERMPMDFVEPVSSVLTTLASLDGGESNAFPPGASLSHMAGSSLMDSQLHFGQPGGGDGLGGARSRPSSGSSKRSGGAKGGAGAGAGTGAGTGTGTGTGAGSISADAGDVSLQHGRLAAKAERERDAVTHAAAQATPAREKSHPLAPPGAVVVEEESTVELAVMRRGVFGAAPGLPTVKSPVLKVWNRGSESDGSDGEC